MAGKSTKTFAGKKASRPNLLKSQTPPTAKSKRLEQLIMKVSQRKAGRALNIANSQISTFNDLLAQGNSVDTKNNMAVLITIEPHFVFAYWEITPEAMLKAAEKTGPEARLVLRFFNISGGKAKRSADSFDIEIFDRIGNWYLKLKNPEQRLSFEVGMKGETKSFAPILTSEVIHMPSQMLAHTAPLKWFKSIEGVPEIAEANTETLKKTLGPYFFDLLMRGRFDSVINSSIEAIFHDIPSLR
jgi:hypothetical protein